MGYNKIDGKKQVLQGGAGTAAQGSPRGVRHRDARQPDSPPLLQRPPQIVTPS